MGTTAEAVCIADTDIANSAVPKGEYRKKKLQYSASWCTSIHGSTQPSLSLELELYIAKQLHQEVFC